MSDPIQARIDRDRAIADGRLPDLTEEDVLRLGARDQVKFVARQAKNVEIVMAKNALDMDALKKSVAAIAANISHNCAAMESAAKRTWTFLAVGFGVIGGLSLLTLASLLLHLVR